MLSQEKFAPYRFLVILYDFSTAMNELAFETKFTTIKVFLFLSKNITDFSCQYSGINSKNGIRVKQYLYVL